MRRVQNRECLSLHFRIDEALSWAAAIPFTTVVLFNAHVSLSNASELRRFCMISSHSSSSTVMKNFYVISRLGMDIVRSFLS